MKKEKRLVSVLIPYRKQGGELSVYLQKRSPDMVLPNTFGFWGGGHEPGETAEQAILRETREELGIELDMDQVEHLDHYIFSRGIVDVYIFEAPDGWEDRVTIGEGEYGKWFTGEEIFSLPNMILQHKMMINDVERHVLGKPIR